MTDSTLTEFPVGGYLSADQAIGSPTVPLAAREARRRVVALVTVLVALTLLVGLVFTGVEPRLAAFMKGSSRLATGLLYGLSFAGFCLVLIRTALWFMYRPAPALTDSELPFVSVVIPAYHEGASVRVAIETALASNYPRTKLEVLCIDDGSGDDTFEHIRDACRQDPRARAFRLPKNRGKRHALYEGFRHAKGDVVVTLDSDSEMLADTLRELVSPLARAEVGAVAGRVLVRNARRNLLTRMLWVQYVVGFDFARAYQSVLGTVFCVPGACAAYRAEVVRDQWLAWRDQTFLGARCNNGDDHHLTTLVLRKGYDVVYQSTASIYTEVPSEYRKLTKMFTRWARSNIRESFVYMSFGCQRAWRTRQPLPLIDGALKVVTNVLRPFMFALPIALLFSNPWAFLSTLGLVAGASLAYSAYYLRFELSPRVLYGAAYGVFAFVALSWVYPYAFLTVRQNNWLTR